MKRRPAKAKPFPWKWVFLLSVAACVLGLFHESLNWGSNSDDGQYYYWAGGRTWGDILGHVFVPGFGDRVFVFGEDRPVQFLYFKIMNALGVSASAFHVIFWGVTAAACWGFGRGFGTLLRLGLTLGEEFDWLMACLLWWMPAVVLGSTTMLIDGIVMGVCATGWFFIYGPKPRLALGLFVEFLACQFHEFAWMMFGWSTLWVLVVRAVRKKRLFDRALVLSTLVVPLHVLLFRSLDPAKANRVEVKRSAELGSMWFLSKLYVLVGFNGVSHPLTDWFGIWSNATGIADSPVPVAFALTFAALLLTFFAKPEGREGKLTWLIPAGAILGTAPYLFISNRAFVYYGLRMTAFFAAFIAARACAAKGRSRRLGILACILLLGGTAYAGHEVLTGWNYVKMYGAQMKQFHQRVMAIPGARECTSEAPCCLKIPGRDWAKGEFVVNWLEGAPKLPKFVQPGEPCVKTIEYHD